MCSKNNYDIVYFVSSAASPLGPRRVPEAFTKANIAKSPPSAYLQHTFGMPSGCSGSLPHPFWKPSGPTWDRNTFGIELLKVLNFGRRRFDSGRLRGAPQAFGNPSGRSRTLRHGFGIFGKSSARLRGPFLYEIK